MSGLEPIIGRSSVSTEDEGEHWLSVSDLMAALMMVFLFVSIALMRSAMIDRDQIREVAIAYQENQIALYNALVAEFEGDLPRWEAEIDPETIAFNFRSPDVLFETGEIELRPGFREILDDFFPRYLGVLAGFRDSIDEVRIEGHTSSRWNRFTSSDDAYFKNMVLSQGRTRSVLNYVYRLPGAMHDRDWVKKHVAAVGYSSSRVVVDGQGQEDAERSRRVSFRVQTNAEAQILRILES